MRAFSLFPQLRRIGARSICVIALSVLALSVLSYGLSPSRAYAGSRTGRGNGCEKKLTKSQKKKAKLFDTEASSPTGGISRDLLNLLWLRSLASSNGSARMLTMLIDSHPENVFRTELRQAVAELSVRNITIIYDADTHFADEFASIAGPRAIGLTSKKERASSGSRLVLYFQASILKAAAFAVPPLVFMNAEYNYRHGPFFALLNRCLSARPTSQGAWEARERPSVLRTGIPREVMSWLSEMDRRSTLPVPSLQMDARAMLDEMPPIMKAALFEGSRQFANTSGEVGGAVWLRRENSSSAGSGGAFGFVKSSSGSSSSGYSSSAWKAEYEERRKRELAAEAELRGKVLTALDGTDVFSQQVRDAITYHWLDSSEVGRGRVALLFGNSVVEPTELQRESTATLVRAMVEANTRVLYDADSRLASTIAEAAGKRGVGLSGRPATADAPPSEHLVVRITNPFLRMRAFAARGGVVGTPDSLLASGEALYRDLRILWAPEGSANFDFPAWARAVRDSGNDLGLSFSTYQPDLIVSGTRLAERLISTYGAGKYSPVGDFSVNWPAYVKELSNSSLETFVRTAENYAEGVKVLDEHPAPAVVFGSGKSHDVFSPMTAQATGALASIGIGTATGGSGGLMEAANRGAFAGGATSIGIPLGYGSSLSSEKHTATDVQSYTFKARGYEVRIPLLLRNRDLVIFAPGADGTVKELATLFVELAADPEAHVWLYFLSSAYYRPLLAQFERMPWPESIKRRIVLTDDPTKLRAIEGVTVTPTVTVKDGGL